MNSLEGKVLGNRYILLEKIGEGGMALVYKARCQLLNRFVAVKILRPEFTSDEEFVKKFRHESLAAASLSHPNIVGIYDVGEQDGIYYIVMEYICGKTLKEYIKEKGKINYREALNISNQIGLALDHAHKNGVVHRDIKPHNILVTEDKIIKVTDFGIARAASSSTMANTGTIMGSVHYFSPEQARGGYTDHRTDIYSLGVVMYEMLTGNLPYDADSPVSIALKHIQENFAPPAMIDDTIPEAVNDIVVRAMEKDVANRYQSIKELIEDIEIARVNPYQRIIHNKVESQLTQVIPVEDIDEAVSRSEKSAKMMKRKKVTIALIITVIAITAITVAAMYGFNKYFIVKDVEIPKVTGMQENDAKKLLEDSKFVFSVAARQNSDKPVGEVIGVIPTEGTVVKEGSEVKVIVSSGKEKVDVPDITNDTVSNAKLTLSGRNLSIGKTDHRYSDTVPKGLIIEQTPTSNSQADSGSSVDVVVSDGAEVKITTVPNLISMTLDQAIKALHDAKLELGDVSYGADYNYDDNVVIDINVAAGTKVPEGQTIGITVNNLSNNNNTNNNTTTDQTGQSTNP